MNATEDLVTSDDHGYLNIPDQVHFYVMINKDSLYMVEARRNDLAKTYFTIQFNQLAPRSVDSTLGDIGGVVDIGNFQEGYCSGWPL